MIVVVVVVVVVIISCCYWCAVVVVVHGDSLHSQTGLGFDQTIWSKYMKLASYVVL